MREVELLAGSYASSSAHLTFSFAPTANRPSPSCLTARSLIRRDVRVWELVFLNRFLGERLELIRSYGREIMGARGEYLGHRLHLDSDAVDGPP